MVKDQIAKVLQKAVADLTQEEIPVSLEHASNLSHGDYTSNVAMVISKKLKKNPMEIANELANILNTSYLIPDTCSRIEAAVPGFINFWLSKEYLLNRIQRQEKELDLDSQLEGMRIMVEFAHPNTHKQFHIGHLRNIALGESICRLLEAQKALVRRVNYQGDVGLHVAKCLWGILQISNIKYQISNLEKTPIGERMRALGEAYSFGSKAYEENERSREEIIRINKQIYEKDPEILLLWEKTRAWSLEYFDSIYQRVGTRFDRLYFESEVYDVGKKIVRDHIQDGIFTQSDGAVVFQGEKYGLHTRVFITKEGNPTYEGKEMGLGPLQYSEFPFDLALHVVGPEQAGYFTVVFKALELVFPELKGKEKHLSYGLVQLKEGKMSSRAGNVVSGEWLLDETKKLLKKQFPEVEDSILEHVAVGSVKYSMLKVGLSQNIPFSLEESISLEGNSGPYLQYTFARTQSVLTKVSKETQETSRFATETNVASVSSGSFVSSETFQSEELTLLRLLSRFEETVLQAGQQYSPNILCTYLFELAKKFNNFYQKHQIIGSSEQEFRIGLTQETGSVLKKGLGLLGIQAPERM